MLALGIDAMRCETKNYVDGLMKSRREEKKGNEAEDAAFVAISQQKGRSEHGLRADGGSGENQAQGFSTRAFGNLNCQLQSTLLDVSVHSLASFIGQKAVKAPMMSSRATADRFNVVAILVQLLASAVVRLA